MYIQQFSAEGRPIAMLLQIMSPIVIIHDGSHTTKMTIKSHIYK